MVTARLERSQHSQFRRTFLKALALPTLVSVCFVVYGAWRNRSADDAYLLWNLFLAWLPLGFAYWLTVTLRHKLWSSWEALAASALWLLFLPNSFYLITDFIHLQEAQRTNILYDALMFSSVIYTGVLIGLCSLLLVHLEIRKRFSSRSSALWIGIIIFICSFGIYLGRDLRWNSWDILTNPGGLLFDVSDRLVHPAAYPEMLLTTASFFVLLGSMYGLVWRMVHLLGNARKN